MQGGYQVQPVKKNQTEESNVCIKAMIYVINKIRFSTAWWHSVCSILLFFTFLPRFKAIDGHYTSLSVHHQSPLLFQRAIQRKRYFEVLYDDYVQTSWSNTAGNANKTGPVEEFCCRGLGGSLHIAHEWEGSWSFLLLHMLHLWSNLHPLWHPNQWTNDTYKGSKWLINKNFGDEKIRTFHQSNKMKAKLILVK